MLDSMISAFLTHTNRILHAVPVPRRLAWSQLLEFQDKAADRRVSGVSEVLFQLLGGKLRVAVSRQDKLPQRLFFLCGLSSKFDYSAGVSGMTEDANSRYGAGAECRHDDDADAGDSGFHRAFFAGIAQ